MNLNDLHKPFPPEAISWRVGSTTRDKLKGLALAYIDARDVMRRLDEVCGATEWQDRYEVHGPKTICYLSIRGGDGDWITKADGAGDSDVEAEKGSLSDSFKRAAVKWGIGRYLYDLESPWVELDTYESNGKVVVKGIKAHEFRRLEGILRGQPAPSQAAPAPANDTPGYKFNKTAPKGVLVDLWNTAWSRAEAGLDAYAGFWKADTTAAERKMLQPWHEDFKAIATDAKPLADLPTDQRTERAG